MPAKPSYSHRLADGAASLELGPEAWVDRLQVEEALGVSKTVAWRIMRHCGAMRGPGGALICDRAELIRHLRHMENDGAVHEREIQRRQRLDSLLSNVRPSTIANMTRVASGERALGLVSSTFRKLPPNVTLTPGSLHIEFSGIEEFLEAVGAVIYALHNDLDELRGWMDQQP